METPDNGGARLQQLADRLDCLIESDLTLLANVNESTTEAWRKRGTGPAYIRVGNRYLYPRPAVAQWLSERTRERQSVAAKAVL
jgi:hypothetical protein